MGDPKKSKSDGPATGQRRVRVSYSPDGFRGVRDYPADVADVMVQEHRAAYVDDSTELGEDVPEGEFRGPLSAKADTSSNGAEGSATAGSAAASTASSAGTAGTSSASAR